MQDYYQAGSYEPNLTKCSFLRLFRPILGPLLGLFKLSMSYEGVQE